MSGFFNRRTPKKNGQALKKALVFKRRDSSVVGLCPGGHALLTTHNGKPAHFFIEEL